MICAHLGSVIASFFVSKYRDMNVELFDARALAPLVSYIDTHGGNAERLLDKEWIPRELIEQGGWVTKQQAYDFTYSVVEHTRCPDSVFNAYLNFDLPCLGPIGDAMRPCKTVKEALETAIRLGSIAYEGSHFFLKIEGEVSWFCYEEQKSISPGRDFVSDMTLMIYYHLIQFATQERWTPDRMRISQKDFRRHNNVEHFDHCRAEFHPRYSALGFPTEFLSRRVPWEPPATKFDETRAYLFGPDKTGSFMEVLYRLLASLLPLKKLPTLKQAAQLMNVSPATLKRRLQMVGTTYSQLRDRLRFDTACDMLAIPQMSIKEIAQELGYSGTNNFVRAFHRMTGATPGQFRIQQQLRNAR